MNLNQVETQIQNFIDANKERVSSVMGGYEPTPANLLAAFVGFGDEREDFVSSLTDGADEFSGLDGEKQKPNKLGKWLELADTLIQGGKAVNNLVNPDKGGNKPNPEPSPINIKKQESEPDKKILGMPKGLFALAVLVLVLLGVFAAVKVMKK